MRQDILDYIKALSLGTFAVANELPWTESGSPLYQRNVKRIYVDLSQDSLDPLISTLSGCNINTKTISTTVYFSTDAKQLPVNYDSLVADIKNGINVVTYPGSNSRVCESVTRYEADLLITELTFRFTKIT